MSRRQLIEFIRRPITAFVPGEITVDDGETGFEEALHSLWTFYSGGGGSIATSTNQAKFGIHSLRIYCSTLVQYAYTIRVIDFGTTGVHQWLAYVYIDDYVGATASWGQYLLSYDTVTTKYPFYWILKPTGVYVSHHSSAEVKVADALSVDTWHQLLVEQDYTSKVCRCWIDGVLVGEWTETTMYAPNRMYIGDTSAVDWGGDFYWDTICYGRQTT